MKQSVRFTSLKKSNKKFRAKRDLAWILSLPSCSMWNIAAPIMPNYSDEAYATGGTIPQITLPPPDAVKKPHERAGWAVAPPPSAYAKARAATPEETAKVAAVLARVESGESVRRASLAVGIERTTLSRLLAAMSDGAERLRAARESQADAIVDSMADDEAETREELSDGANQPIAGALVSFARLRFDRKKFQASAFAPSIYGAKAGAGGVNVAVQVNTLSPDRLAAARARAAARFKGLEGADAGEDGDGEREASD
jgi:hypothetical protein